jgi:hypothetical protein
VLPLLETGVETMRKMIDLYSGLGGASEPFVKAGWDVMRCENNPTLLEVESTWEFDLTDNLDVDTLIHMPYWDDADLIWASPPCLEFSRGYNAPAPTAEREGREFKPDMKPLKSALKIIKEKNPKWWVIENVAGASKIFSKHMNVKAPTQIIGPYFLWGKFPHISMSWDWKRKKGKTQDWNIGDPLRANKRALVDFEVADNLRKAIETQKKLEEWI